MIGDAGEPRYVVITLSDALTIASALRDPERAKGHPDVHRIVERLRHETGADMQDIVTQLQGANICGVCEHEGQAEYCRIIDVRKQGRRLRRLLERVRGIWPKPGPEEPLNNG